MKILVVGTGLQGRAALHDLAQSPDVSRVIAADADLEGLERYLDRLASPKITPTRVDASDRSQVAALMRTVDASILLLPPALSAKTVEIAVKSGCHWVDASYSRPEYAELDNEARKKGLAILPEFGLDPGIDLVLAAAVLRDLDEVETFNTYGAGFPEAGAADNPIKYKISWTFAGVLRSYNRPARLLLSGDIVDVPAAEIFAPENVHAVELSSIGELEAYPNGDAIKYLRLLGLEGKAQNAGRYSMRWPGHAAFWRTMAGLGFLSDEEIRVGDSAVVPRQFVHDLLLPQLQYQTAERDVAVVLVDATGSFKGRPRRVIYRVIDRRDLATGFLAMQRTVGFTASIGAQMILRGDIQNRGLLSPVVDVPIETFFDELGKRGIQVERQFKE